MSIFKNSMFSKATAYIVSAGSLVPILSRDCSSVNVFAEGKAQKIFEFFKSILSRLLSRFLNEENVKKALNYLGLLAKEQDEKDGKEQKGEDKKEEKDEDNREGKGENDQNYAPAPIPVKKEEYIEFKEDFDLGTIKKIDEICDGLADVSTDFFDRLDAKNFNLDPNCLFYGFKDICHVVGNFDRLNSDSCSFETDNQGNLAIRSKWRCSEGKTVEENFHFKVNENGMILVDLYGKVVPFRLVDIENSKLGYSHPSKENLITCCAYAYIDVDVILRTCLLIRGNWDTFGVRDNILKLKNIFERKDNNKVFLNKINDAIDIWNLLTPIVSKLNSQFSSNVDGYKEEDCDKWNAFLREQKIVYMHNFLTELFKIIKDKKVKERVRKMLYSAVYRLYSIFQKESGVLPGSKVLTSDNCFVNFSQ